MNEVLSIFNYRSNIAREEKFEEFHKKYSKLTSRTYPSYSELYNEVFDFDVYCVGSDQVWNPTNNTSLNPYFLTFAPKGKRKIAYASSFGISIFPDAFKKLLPKLLSDFDFVSVREKTAANNIKEIANKNAEVVLDPTLLLTKSEWLDVANSNILPSYPYLLIYNVSKSNFATKLAVDIAKIKNLKVVRLCINPYRDDYNSEISNIVDAGPSEFVALFSAASFIVTNSFHGTAFAVNFNKPFFSVINHSKINNSRQKDFLDSLGLSNRIIIETKIFSTRDVDCLIDYDIVNSLLEIQKTNSVNFLRESITI
jgi:polysaccharide pyruvyl transferase WcaK-like protein